MPTGDACELDRLTLKNKTDAVKELDVFSYVEFCLWDAIDDSSNFQRNFSTGEVEVEPAIIYHKTERTTSCSPTRFPAIFPSPLMTKTRRPYTRIFDTDITDSIQHETFPMYLTLNVSL